MKLTVHIGMGKTGTTALQSFLNKEKDGLRRNGVVYAGTRLEKLLSETPIKDQGDVNDSRKLELALQSLNREVKKRSDVRQVIWSNESLSMGRGYEKTAQVIHSFAERSETHFDEVEIILVLRRQDEWIESAYRQWALKHKVKKSNGVLSPGEYFESVKWLLDYRALVSAWEGAHGERLKVFSYDDIKSQGGVVKFFCAQWSVPYIDRFDDYSSTHTSLDASLSYFISLYNRAFKRQVKPVEFLPVMKDANILGLARSGGDKSFYDKALREEVLSHCAHSNEELSLYLKGDGSFFSSAEPKDSVKYEVDCEEMITYLMIINKNQQDRIERLNKRLHRLEVGEKATSNKQREKATSNGRKILGLLKRSGRD